MLHIGIQFMHCIFCFIYVAFWTGNKIKQNFNLNYLSSMFLDLAHYDTTTTIFEKGFLMVVDDIGRIPLDRKTIDELLISYKLVGV